MSKSFFRLRRKKKKMSRELNRIKERKNNYYLTTQSMHLLHSHSIFDHLYTCDVELIMMVAELVCIIICLFSFLFSLTHIILDISIAKESMPQTHKIYELFEPLNTIRSFECESCQMKQGFKNK